MSSIVIGELENGMHLVTMKKCVFVVATTTQRLIDRTLQTDEAQMVTFAKVYKDFFSRPYYSIVLLVPV